MAIDSLFSLLLTDWQLLKPDRVENPPQWALNGWDSQSHVLARRYSEMETQASIFPHKVLNPRVLDQMKISLDHYVGPEWWGHTPGLPPKTTRLPQNRWLYWKDWPLGWCRLPSLLKTVVGCCQLALTSLPLLPCTASRGSIQDAHL